MTVPQVLHAIGIDVENLENSARIAESIASKRARIYDTICEKHGLDPRRLAARPTAEIIGLLREELGPTSSINADQVRTSVNEWLKSKNGDGHG